MLWRDVAWRYSSRLRNLTKRRNSVGRLSEAINKEMSVREVENESEGKKGEASNEIRWQNSHH